MVDAKNEREMWRCCLYLKARVAFAKGAGFQPSQLRKLRTACLQQARAECPKKEDIFGSFLHSLDSLYSSVGPQSIFSCGSHLPP